MKNINSYVPKHIDIKTPLKGVQAGSGTFKEILDGVYSGKIYALTDEHGNIIGMGVDTGKTGAEDSIELEKFKIRYNAMTAMRYFEEAFKLCYEQKATIKKVIEEPNFIQVELANGEKVTILDRRTSSQRRAEELPEEVEIPINDLDVDSNGQLMVKKYLKETYGHYLAGGVGEQFSAEEGADANGNEILIVRDIKWGRKV